ncbi:MAG: protein kinase [Rikenellaceae bacterium]
MYLGANTFLKGGKYRILNFLGQGIYDITYSAEYKAVQCKDMVSITKAQKIIIKEFFMKGFSDRKKGASHVSVASLADYNYVAKEKQKYINEAQSITDLRCTHVVNILDIFEENNTVYCVLEYVEYGLLNDGVEGHAENTKRSINLVLSVIIPVIALLLVVIGSVLYFTRTEIDLEFIPMAYVEGKSILMS